MPLCSRGDKKFPKMKIILLASLVVGSPIVGSNSRMLFSSAGLTPLCSDPTSKCDLVDLSKYLGTWYEIGRTKAIDRFEGNDVCVQANYSMVNPKLVKVVNSGVGDGKPNQITGSAKVLSPSELLVSFFVPPIGSTPNYVIKNIWTNGNGDYKRALVVSPKGSDESLQNIWILARDTVISDQDIKETLAFVTSAGYNPVASEWKRTEQVTCR